MVARRSQARAATSAGAAGQVGALPDDPGFDPARVPVYPVVRIALRRSESDSDLVEGLVDEAVVGCAADRGEVRQAVVDAVAGRARERPGQAIRAKGQDRVAAPDGDGSAGVWEMVVTAEGHTYDLPRARPGASRRRTGSFLPWALVAAGVVVVVAVVAAAVLLIGNRSSSAAPVRPPRPTATQLPVPGPPGWSAQASWSVPAGEHGSGADRGVRVSTDGQRVFAPGRGSSVAAYQVRTGVRVWSGKVDGTVKTGPAVTTVDGSPAVVAATATRLYVWSLSGRSLLAAKLPAQGADVTVGAGGPLVRGQNNGQHVWLVRHRRLVARVLPAGAQAVTPTGGGAMVAAGPPGKLWRSGSDRTAGAAVSLKGPKDTRFVGVAGASARVLVGVYASKGGAGGGDVVLRGFAGPTARPVWTSKPVPQAQTNNDSADPLQVAHPSGRWGIYGSSTVDLDTGKVADLPQDWQTSTVGDRVAFGTSSGAPMAATRSGLAAGSEQSAGADQGAGEPPDTGAGGTAGTGDADTAAPAAVVGDTAMVLARDGQREHLYAVPRAHRAQPRQGADRSGASTGSSTAGSGSPEGAARSSGGHG